MANLQGGGQVALKRLRGLTVDQLAEQIVAVPGQLAIILLNDPNGFCQVAGRYHLFYQWNPLACDHTYKCWGHWSSADLL
ncbi:hypothetical protein, partial [Klebsiella pneumoniae]|uniref:hypothetical protein n=1 Tax=Klebsiella pneumoniae TaxID=573 RepID=UPI00214CF5C9